MSKRDRHGVRYQRRWDDPGESRTYRADDGLREAVGRFLDMLAPGGALYGCGEKHLRESAVLYLSNALASPPARALERTEP